MEKEINGKQFEIRPLTRGEVKKLRRDGFNLANLSVASADDAVDAVFELAVPGMAEDIDALPNPDALELFKCVMEATYGGPAEKN